VKTLHLVVPSPADPDRLDRFLSAQVPELGRRAARGVIEAGGVDVDGAVERGSGRRLRPGQRVEVRYRPGRLPDAAITPDDVLARGPDWLAVHKPAGLSTHRSEESGIGVPERLGAALGGDARGYWPAHRLDRGTSGVLLVATTEEAAARLSGAFAERTAEKEYVAVVSPGPRGEEGEEREEGMSLQWRVLRRSPDGRRAELSVRPREGRTHQVRRQLAAAGTPIVGDLEHGRCVPGGAARMALHCRGVRLPGVEASCDPPAGWDELLASPRASSPSPPAASPAPRSSLPSLRVSPATARVLRGGHPWVLRDPGTGSTERFRPGDVVQLVDPGGAPVAVAVVDPEAEICARVLGGSGPVDWGARGRSALRRRKTLLEDAGTTALRLIHGEADGVPGLLVDLWGDLAVATVTCEAARAVAPAIYDVLREELPLSALVEQDHLTDLRKQGPPQDATLPSRTVFGAAPSGRIEVVEDGRRFLVEPTAGLTTGLYTDQRTNRRRCAERAEGAVVANLFAHTGAFSVALAAAGAQRVFAVDLGQRYLRWAADNLARNGLDPEQHPGVAADAIDWLRRESEPLHGAVLDPPSHARRKGRNDRDWNARRDYVDLVEATARRLRPGGWMLCCVNSKGVRRQWLPDTVNKGVERAGRRLAETEPAGPAADHPRLKGFPEGVAFVGLLATLE
jgi:23S rRNA (cytosine1962-C5)-methyltransferase